MKSILTLFALAAALQLTAQKWTTAELSEARFHSSMATNGQVLVIAGGVKGQNTAYSDRVDIYDAATGIWAQAQLPSKRSWMASASAGDKVIFAGGFELDTVSGADIFIDAVEIYDVKTKTWSSQKLPLGPRGYMRGIGVGKKAYFMGGFSDPAMAMATTTVQIYDTETGAWSSGANIPFTSGLAAIAVFGKKIMLKRSAIYGVYDTETDSWESQAFPAATPFRPSPVVTPTEVWMVGGYNGADFSGSNHILKYNIATKTWADAAPLLVSRCFTAAAFLNGKVIIGGGAYEDSFSPDVTTDLVEIYDTLTGTWDTQFMLSKPRGYLDYQETAPVICNRAFFPGGDLSEGMETSRVDIYTDTSAVGTFLPKLPEASFGISPSPCRDFVEISLRLPVGETGWLTICDAQGRSFFKQKIQPGSPPELAIDTKDWPSGSFVATVSTTRGVRAKPLVKVK